MEQALLDIELNVIAITDLEHIICTFSAQIVLAR